MKGLFIAALCAALLVGESNVVAANVPLLELTADSFKSTLKQSTVFVVTFYLPWCAHSKKWTPEFEKAVSQLNAPYSAARVDASAYADLASEFTTTDLMPEVRVFFKGVTSTSISYTGERTAESLLAFLLRAQKGMLEASTKAEYDQALHAASIDAPNAVVVSGFFAEGNAAERDTYLDVFNTLRGTHVFIAATADVAKTLNKPVPSIVAAKKGLGETVYEGGLQDNAALERFARERQFPVFGEMEPGPVFEAYASRGRPIAWLFVDVNDKAAKSIVSTLAPQFDTLSFVWIDGTKYTPMMDQLGLPADVALPAFAIENGTQHYAFSQKVCSIFE